eukprot:TRINITY_DN27073_c0_g1_i1.p1 TRINITY_DN27073_c0_g1~~TRINITY_DN27073_c0_g1_i1.p1  ORF type:complete len:911 (-),score=164.73 TRINITY_DN27073_c0_g1_i1:161-2806(-)
MAKVAPFTGDDGDVPDPPPKRRVSVTQSFSGNLDNRGHLTKFKSRLRNLAISSGWYDSAFAITFRKFLRGRCFGITTMIALVLALFLSEFFVVFQVPTNTELDVVLTIVFAIFLVEWIGLSVTDFSYIFGFFFWMDGLGTLSMVMDISYMFGTSASELDIISSDNRAGKPDVMIVRVARIVKLSARSARLSRALKLLRMLPIFGGTAEDDQKVKMARVISNQLNTVLSTRVAFLTICVVVVLPLLDIINYPESDDGMLAWATIMGRTAEQIALAPYNSSEQVYHIRWLEQEAERFMKSYNSNSYGPYMVCYGRVGGGGETGFTCNKTAVDLSKYTSKFSEPDRKHSIQLYNQDYLSMGFNLAEPKTQEAISGILLIVFIVLVMCSFALIMSNSIGNVALKPLERMLAVVRQRCQQIFKYTTELKEDDESEEDEEEEYDIDNSSEFKLLEKVVQKLAAIAHLSSAGGEPQVKEDMTENEIMALNWMQGANVASAQHGKVRPSGVQEDKDPPLYRELDGILGKIPLEAREELDTPFFNAIEKSSEMQIAIAAYVVTCHEGCSQWVSDRVPHSNLLKFMTDVEAKYPPNPFHNYAHGLDVLYSVARFMRRANIVSTMSETTQFWVLVAAIGHDVGHLGVNNQYLVETGHEIAVRYNDRSPLENMHCATLFQIASSSPEGNIFAKVEKDVYKEMRMRMITAILHTDMMKHNEMIKELGLLYNLNTEQFDDLNPQAVFTGNTGHIQTIMNALLHGADIGNPMKPWDLAYKLAHLCVDEFFAQGDMEKERGIPVQMLNDRDKVNRPNSQVGFIEFVICPMAESLVNIFPQLDRLAMDLSTNVQKWCELWIAEVSPPDDQKAKVQARVEKIVARMEAVTRESRGIRDG